MLHWFRARGANARKAKELYGAVVAAARHPQFYRAYGIPDTLNGRYEMIVLTLFQLLERLRADGPGVEETSRMTLEAFFTDMDDCMREIGVGDLSVPKKVKKAAAGFYERAQAYRAALDGGDAAALAAELERFIAGDGMSERDASPPPDAERTPATEPGGAWAGAGAGAGGEAFAALARHAFAQRDHLAAASPDSVLAGTAFLAPE